VHNEFNQSNSSHPFRLVENHRLEPYAAFFNRLSSKLFESEGREVEMSNPTYFDSSKHLRMLLPNLYDAVAAAIVVLCINSVAFCPSLKFFEH
jgi:hypothetical protein